MRLAGGFSISLGITCFVDLPGYRILFLTNREIHQLIKQMSNNYPKVLFCDVDVAANDFLECSDR